MEEERDQVRPPVAPTAPDLPVTTPSTSSEIDDATVRAATAAGIGTTSSRTTVAGAGTGSPGPAVAASAPVSDDPEEIKQQIERTREGMSDTLNELQQRLSPQHIADQAKASVREATVGRVQHLMGSAGDTATQVAGRAQQAAGVAVEQVREHPIPAALAGAGAGLVWWLMRRSSNRQTWSNDDMYDWDDADVTYDRDYASLEVRGGDDWRSDRSWGDGRSGGWMRILRDNPIPASIAAASIGYMLWNRRSASGSYDTMGVRSAYGYGEEGYDADSTSSIGSATSRARDAARDVSRQAREKAHELGEQVSESLHSAQERANAMSRDVSQRMRTARYRTSSQLDRWMHENPMAVGVAALAAGAVVGLSVPRTRAEDQVMGASRDALIDKANDQAHHLKDQVREKVQSVAGLAGIGESNRDTETTARASGTEATGSTTASPPSGGSTTGV